MNILFIENSKSVSQTILPLLEQKNHSVQVVPDAAADSVELSYCDLLLLDGTAPDWDGFTLIHRLHAKRTSVFVLALTAGGTEERIQALDAGADYALSVPFDSREFLSVVTALGRHLNNQNDEMVWGNTILDLSSCMLICGDNSVRLSAREFNVMRFLMQSGKRNLPKETILQRVWGSDSSATENYVEVYVGFLRKKLKEIGSNVRIEAIRWQGYHLEIVE